MVFGRHLARDLRHGKQRVSPFCHVSQLLHEKDVFRSPVNGTFFLHLARDWCHGKRSIMIWVWILVGLIGNFWIVEQLLHLVVEQLLNPIFSSSHVSRKSLEEEVVQH